MTFAARFIGWVNSLFQAERSLRFRSGAYVSRTFGSGNRTTWTWSGCVKRGVIGTAQILFSTDNSNRISLGMNTSDSLEFECYNGAGADYFIGSTALLRDTSSHYHIVIVWDTNNAVAADRMRMFINGVRVTMFSVSGNTIPLGALSNINSGVVHNLGRSPLAAYPFDGYLSEVNFIDGQALSPTAFGQFDSFGNWTAKRYSGSYGTNGFYLPFKDTSSTANLVKDESGNGNNFTPTGISLTAGSTYDSMLDVPLGGGGNERGNYATLNPLTAIAGAVSSANLSYTSTVTHGTILATQPALSGKTYWEATISSSSVAGGLGISVARNGLNAYPGGLTGLWWAYDNGSAFSIFDETTTTASGGGRFSISQVWRVAVDVAAGKAWLGYSLGWLDSANGLTGNPATGANPTFTFTSGTEVFPFFESAAVAWHVNYGQRPFNDTPPAGFLALHTGNLPEPSIRNPKKHFDVVTRIGTDGGSNTIAATISSLQFQPDLLWTKTRNSVQNNAVFDSIRTSGKKLQTNTTNAESTSTPDNTQTFISNGYVTGKGDDTNGSGITFVDWLWKAGGSTTTTNNAGSITAQVSVNPSAGFSIVTYTGSLTTTGSASIGHGLGVAPKMVISKSRNVAGSDSGSWMVQHVSLGTDDFLYLNSTSAAIDAVATGGGQLFKPTSDAFYSTWNSGGALSGNNYVAYCFAEILGHSKIGGYTANASADGPFVYCGFRPRFIIIKRTDSTGEWRMYDSARSDINPVDDVLRAEQATAEGVSLSLDFTATGFKIRTTDANLNGGAAPYIFMAFAEAPLKYALAR